MEGPARGSDIHSLLKDFEEVTDEAYQTLRMFVPY